MKINRKLPKIKQNTNKVDMKNQTKKDTYRWVERPTLKTRGS